MTNRMGIFGTSGMAREAGDIAWEFGLEVIYVAKDESEFHGTDFAGEVIFEKDIAKYETLPFVIGIGENNIRKTIAERFKGLLRFTNLIHPSATFGRRQREVLQSCQGVIVAAGSRLTSGIELGNFCIINQNVTIAHDCTIDHYVHVAPGANISGNVHLKERCWVGAGAVINQGSNTEKRVIGENTLVGSGSVVTKDCEPNAVYAGVPAKRIK